NRGDARLRQCAGISPGAVVTASLSAYRRATKTYSWLLSSSGDRRVDRHEPAQNGLVPSCVSAAAWELERADARLPGPRIRRRPPAGVVLVNVPEGAAGARVDAHRGVVAPARVRRRLPAGAVLQHRLGLRELAERITVQPPGVADAREHVRPVDDAVADRE